MDKLRLLSLLVKSVVRTVHGTLVSHYRYALMQSKYRTCIIYSTSRINNSTLSDWVVVFDNVILHNCHVGKHSYIQKNSRIFNCNIGNFCSIASNVSIAPGLHVMTGVSTHPSFYLKNTPLAITFAEKDVFEPQKEVSIGHDVWIGENVIILDGITVGTGAIIAAGSVVSKNVEPYCVVGGVPAKLLKYRFSSDIIAALLKSEWWNRPNSWLKENYESFRDISNFLSAVELKDKNV